MFRKVIEKKKKNNITVHIINTKFSIEKRKPTKPDMLDKFSRNNIFDSNDYYRYMYCTYVRINPTHNSICCGEL